MQEPSKAPSLIRVCVLLVLALLTNPPAVSAMQTSQVGPLAAHTTGNTDPVTAGSEMGPIAAGWFHTCALTPTGGVLCWGRNDYGQLGNNSTTDSSIPVHVVGLSSGVRAIAAGEWHTCALTTTGGVFCWGGNSLGQLGNHSFEGSLTPVSVWGLSSGVSAIAAGFFHTCALTTTEGMLCWGHNGNGQLGDNSYVVRTVPTAVWELSSGVSAIAAGFYHTCALTTAGGVKCWGDNLFGQLGNNSTTGSLVPVDVTNLSSGASAIAAGDWHTCALTTIGGAKCWGSNSSGELGYPPNFGSSVPVNVSGLSGGASAIAAGGAHNCVLTASGGMKCWGANGSGELGNNDRFHSSYTPVDVWGLSSGVSAMAAGQVHTCALTTTGGMKCWGANYRGQLGNNSTTGSNIPVDVAEPAPPGLTINYTTGRPGSYFTLTGGNFSVSGSVAISINSYVFPDTVPVDAAGSFVFFLDTTNADVGWYRVTASDISGSAVEAGLGQAAASANLSAGASFMLDDSAALRLPAGSGQTLAVPAGIAVPAHRLYLPLLLRH